MKQKANILFLQEEEMRGFHKKKDPKEKMPLKETDISANKLTKDRAFEQNETFVKKDGKEWLIIKIINYLFMFIETLIKEAQAP